MSRHIGTAETLRRRVFRHRPAADRRGFAVRCLPPSPTADLTLEDEGGDGLLSLLHPVLVLLLPGRVHRCNLDAQAWSDLTGVEPLVFDNRTPPHDFDFQRTNLDQQGFPKTNKEVANNQDGYLSY